MKKYAKSVIIFIMAAALLVSGCHDGGEPTPTPSTSPEIEVYDPAKDVGEKTGYIVKDGVSSYEIIIPQNAPEAVDYAAKELSNFVAQATGVELPVKTDEGRTYSDEDTVISLGKTVYLKGASLAVDYGALNYDGFITKTKNKLLIIDGARDAGVLYGVYNFLEITLGIKFLTSSYTYIPKTGELAFFDMNITEAPAFAIRDYYSAQTMGDPTFSARCRMNSSHKRDSVKYGTNGAWDYYYGSGHTTIKLMPGTQYVADHREWYANDEGTELCYTNGIGDDGQIDFSNEDSGAMKMLEVCKEKILESPDSRYIMIGQNDNSVWCNCAKCKASDAKYGGKSGTLMVYINAVAKALEDWAKAENITSEINVVTFAYWKTLQPPVKTLADGSVEPAHPYVVARDNVVVQIAHMSCFEHSVLDADCLQNALIRSQFKGWNAITKRLTIWDYATNFSHNLWYFPNLGVLQDNLFYYRELGVEHIMTQGAPHVNGYYQGDLEMWLNGKLMWNPNYDVEELIKEFNKYYFGENACQYANDFLDLMNYHFASLDASSESGFHSDLYESTNFLDFVNYPIGLLENACNVINAGIKAVREDQTLSPSLAETYERHFISALIQPQYMILKNYTAYYSSDTLTEFAQDFFANVDLLGITYYSEGGSIKDLKAQYGVS